jgi:hypothetical protein
VVAAAGLDLPCGHSLHVAGALSLSSLKFPGLQSSQGEETSAVDLLPSAQNLHVDS